MKYFTYVHFRPDGVPFYVGKGSGRRATKRGGRNQHWHRIVNKYGNFTCEIMCRFHNESEAFQHEIFLIQCFLSMGFVLANHSLGGEGPTGHKHTKEHNQKISVARKGIQFTEEHKASLKKVQKNRTWIARKKAVRVICFDGQEITFSNCAIASKYFNVKAGTFRSWAQGLRNVHHPQIQTIISCPDILIE